MGHGLVSAEDETWKVISSSFNFEFLKANMSVVQNTTKELLNKISSSKEECKNYSVISRIQDITGEIVGRIFFGDNLNNYSFESRSLILALVDLTSQLSLLRRSWSNPFWTCYFKLPLPNYRKIMQRVKGFRQVCLDIINDRKSKPDSNTNDFLSSLLDTQKSEDIERRFSDEDIIDEYVTFFIAGMDSLHQHLMRNILRMHISLIRPGGLIRNLRLIPMHLHLFLLGQGIVLALMEAKVIVSEFLKRFEFTVKDVYELKMIFRFLYEPVEGIVLNLQPKLK